MITLSHLRCSRMKTKTLRNIMINLFLKSVYFKTPLRKGMKPLTLLRIRCKSMRSFRTWSSWGARTQRFKAKWRRRLDRVWTGRAPCSSRRRSLRDSWIRPSRTTPTWRRSFESTSPSSKQTTFISSNTRQRSPRWPSRCSTKRAKSSNYWATKMTSSASATSNMSRRSVTSRQESPAWPTCTPSRTKDPPES